MRVRLVAGVIALGFTIAPRAAAQAPAVPQTARAAIDGTVTDTSLVPVSDATVSVLGTPVRVTTGTNGRFRITSLPVGDYQLQVRRIGFEATYARVHLTRGDTARVAYALRRVWPTWMDTVRVTERFLTPAMQEFEARRKMGIGHFVTQEQLDQPRVVFTTDALQTIPGVYVLTNPKHTVVNTRSGCPYEIYLDGTKMPEKGDVDGIVFAKEVAGIEVYSGPAQIPVQYKATSGGGFCGVILLWTRIGS